VQSGPRLGRPTQDLIRRVALAMGKSGRAAPGSDLFTLAVVAIGALTVDDLHMLLPPAKNRATAQTIGQDHGQHVHA
jgi:hypothetical protein